MAYPHDKQEIQFTSTAGSFRLSATATGDKAYWTCGFVPHIVRGFAVAPLTTGIPLDTPNFILKHLSLTSGSTATSIATLQGVASDKPGHVIYASGLNVTVDPGEQLIFNVGAAATITGCVVAAMVYVEPKWEQPTNDTSMRATTATNA